MSFLILSKTDIYKVTNGTDNCKPINVSDIYKTFNGKISQSQTYLRHTINNALVPPTIQFLLAPDMQVCKDYVELYWKFNQQQMESCCPKVRI